MNVYHRELAEGRWSRLDFAQQLANVGSEITRAIHWRGKSPESYGKSVERALELLDLTIGDIRWRGRLKEVIRVREALCETVFGENEYRTSLEDFDRYFFSFALVSKRGE